MMYLLAEEVEEYCRWYKHRGTISREVYRIQGPILLCHTDILIPQG